MTELTATISHVAAVWKRIVTAADQTNDWNRWITFKWPWKLKFKGLGSTSWSLFWYHWIRGPAHVKPRFHLFISYGRTNTRHQDTLKHCTCMYTQSYRIGAWRANPYSDPERQCVSRGRLSEFDVRVLDWSSTCTRCWPDTALANWDSEWIRGCCRCCPYKCDLWRNIDKRALYHTSARALINGLSPLLPNDVSVQWVGLIYVFKCCQMYFEIWTSRCNLMRYLARSGVCRLACPRAAVVPFCNVNVKCEM